LTNIKPQRVDQIIPSIIEHDAVSNHTFHAQYLLREMGYESEIYAMVLGPGVEGRVRHLDDFRSGHDGGHWVMYQCSIGSPAAEVFAAHPHTKLLDYHNITPGHLVERWLPPLGAETTLGRQQLAQLAPIVDFAIADSPYNASELVARGYRHAEVVPILISIDNLTDLADVVVLDRYGDQPGHDWLFVGQIAPHKAQHDVIMAFARYRTLFDPHARLHLVGREMGSAYRNALVYFIKSLGLEGIVNMPGSVTASQLAAYYELADVFVCLSDHEGFCAPITEAMSRGLVVVAYGVAAVPGTVGDAGVVLADKDPDHVASVVHELFRTPALVNELKERGHVQATSFTLDRAETCFRTSIARAIELLI
jgi:glycosyltransferase involved in cell wall biosynthesis